MRLIRRLALLGPGPPAFFSDAANLAFEADGNFFTGFHLVGHALREVDSAVRDVLLPRGFTKPKKGGHHAEIEAICLWLGYESDDGLVTRWKALADDAHKNAHRRSLAKPTGGKPEMRQLVLQWEAVFDDVLERYEGKYRAAVPLLESLAGKISPTNDDIEELMNRVPNNLGALSLFFDRLQSPLWLRRLSEAGYFQDPPEPEVDPETSGVRFPRWPQADYLARMAPLDPGIVSEVLNGIAATRNFRVTDPLLDCCLKLPIEQVVQLTPRIASWLDLPFLGTVADKAADIVGRLVEEGHTEEARTVALALLDAELGLGRSSA